MAVMSNFPPTAVSKPACVRLACSCIASFSLGTAAFSVWSILHGATVALAISHGIPHWTWVQWHACVALVAACLVAMWSTPVLALVLGPRYSARSAALVALGVLGSIAYGVAVATGSLPPSLVTPAAASIAAHVARAVAAAAAAAAASA